MKPGDYVRQVRIARKLSQVELARISTLSPSFISLLERNLRQDITSDTVQKLTRALKIPIKEWYRVVGGGLSENLKPAPSKTPQEIIKELNATLPVLIPVYNKLGDKEQDHYIFYPKELLGGHDNMRVSGFYVSNSYKDICREGDLAICVPIKNVQVDDGDICLYPDNTVRQYKPGNDNCWVIIDIIRHIKNLRIKDS